MPDNPQVHRSTLSAKETQLVNAIHKSDAVNFDAIGKVVADVGPQLFDPGVAADDYIAKAYSSVIQVWKTLGGVPQLEDMAALKQIGARVGG